MAFPGDAMRIHGDIYPGITSRLKAVRRLLQAGLWGNSLHAHEHNCRYDSCRVNSPIVILPGTKRHCRGAGGSFLRPAAVDAEKWPKIRIAGAGRKWPVSPRASLRRFIDSSLRKMRHQKLEQDADGGGEVVALGVYCVDVRRVARFPFWC